MIDASSYNQNGQIANDTSHNANKNKQSFKLRNTKTMQSLTLVTFHGCPLSKNHERSQSNPRTSMPTRKGYQITGGETPPFLFCCFERNKKHTNPWSSSWITVWTVRTTQRTKNLLYFHRTRSRERHQHNTRNPDGS